jgi:pyrimidine-specific ribonucleoside hydrolase
VSAASAVTATAPVTAASAGPPIPVILDCDPGHDDALAITLALARPELRVLGITTVGGNAGLANTTRNALRVLALLGRPDVPVAAGADQPLVRVLETAPAVHGASGLDGADLPEPVSAPRPEGAVEFLRATLAASPGPVTLIPTGPLTNVALLLRAHPEAAAKIAHVCLMGGSMGAGNWTPAAEFNIWVDPEAARIVFRSGLPITMVGLDVTHKALMGLPEVDRLRALGTRPGNVFADLLLFFTRFHVERYGTADTPIHDAVAVAHVALPGLVTTRRYHVDVETTGDITRGRTVVDDRGQAASAGATPNVDVALDIDRATFADLVIDAVASFR